MSYMLGNKEEYKNALGSFLKNARKNLGKSVRGLSKETGISESVIRQYETGISDPTFFNLLKLREALLIDDLAGFYEGVTPPEMTESLNLVWNRTFENSEKESYKHAIGAFFRKKRQAEKKTLKQLSNQTDISVSNIKQYETGASDPSSFNFFKLAKALRITDLKEFYTDIYCDFVLDGAPNAETEPKPEDDLLNEQIFEYMCKLHTLNPEGIKKVFDFIDLIKSHPNYQKEGGPDAG